MAGAGPAMALMKRSVLDVRNRDHVRRDHADGLLLAAAGGHLPGGAFALADDGAVLDRLRTDAGRFPARGRSRGGDLGGLLGLLLGLLVGGLAGGLRLGTRQLL